MKKLLGTILAIFAFAPVAQAFNVVYSGVMVSTNGNMQETAKASTQTYTIDVNNAGGDVISMQIAYSSAVIPSFTFTDGSISTFTAIIVSTQALVGVAATDTLTILTNKYLTPTVGSATICVASNSFLNTSTISINSTTLTFGKEVSIDLTASSNTAINLAAAINNDVPNVFAFVNSVGGSSVAVVSNSSGSFVNAYTVGTSTKAVTVTAWANGNDYASFSINGSTYTNGRDWFSAALASNTAIAIMNDINLSRRDVIASTSASTVVTFTAVSSGAYANAFTLASSTAALAVGGATFSSGQNEASLVINGVSYVAGVDYLIGGSTKTAAINLASAINADARLNTVIVATAVVTVGSSWGVVWATATQVGTTYNYTTRSSTQSALTIGPYVSSSPATGIATGVMVGGTNAAYSLSTPTIITKASHGLTTGYQVYLSTSSGVIPAPLVWGTTYYAIKVDANNFSLALTSTGSVAGLAVTITSSRTLTAPDTFTMNTDALSGTAQFILQGGDDGLNWTPVTLGEFGQAITTTASFASPYTSSSVLWDLGTWHHRYLRLLYNAPTTGGVAFTSSWNLKSNK